LVLCNGPQAPYHIYKNFGSVLPSVQAQGYCFDIEYEDLSLHRNLSLKLGDSPYSYCPYLPGKLRFSAGFEIGCFKEPYFDEKRMKYFKSWLQKDLALSDIDSRI